MTSRALRQLFVALSCVLAALAAGAVHAHGVTLKTQHALSADSAFHTQFLLPWAKKLEDASAGRLRLQLSAASAPAFEQVQRGEVHIAWLACASAQRHALLHQFVPPPDASNAERASAALWEYVRANDIAKKEFDGVRLLGVAVAAPAGKPAAFYALIMDAAEFKSLPDDLRQVINTHSGAETSAWLGKVLEQTDAGR